MLGLIRNNLKNSWLLAAFLIVALILWNTNLLFGTLKKEERKKNEVMGAGSRGSNRKQCG